MPNDLDDNQRDKRYTICNLLNRLHRQQPRVIRNTVTMDESWVYLYDPALKETTREWLRKEENRPQKPRRTLAVGKVMIVTFFDSQGLVYHEFVQHPLTMNQQVFRQIFQCFPEAFLRRRPRGTVHGRRFIHMDNAPSHNATLSLAFVRNLGWTRLPQPPYSPDLAPNDFFFYPRLKRNLHRQFFRNLEELKELVMDEIGQISAMEYRHCMLVRWPVRWVRCIQHHGGYFEGMVQ